MKRGLCLLLAVALCSLLWAVPMVGAEGEEKVNITFMSHIYKPWNDVLTRQAREFEEQNPNITIEYSTIEHADLNIKLMTSLAAGAAPDIMGIYGPWMAELVTNGWLDPAPDYVREDIEQNTFAVAGESAEYGGELYGYIQHIGIPTPIVNVDLYENAGLEYPTTYEELLEVNKVLDVYNGDVLSQAGTVLSATKGGSWNVIHWSSILNAYGGSILNEDNTAAAFNTPEGLEATEVYKQLTHADFVPDSFVQGFAAMEWNGPWTRASYEENNPDLNYKALAPMAGPEGMKSTMYAWFWAVAADAPQANKDAAWKFLNFISGDEKYLELANEVGFISFRTANFDDPTYASDEWIAAFGQTLEVADTYYAKIPQWEKIDVAIGTEFERMCVDEITIEEALANAEKLVNEILAQG